MKEIGLCSVCGGVVYSGTLYEIEKGEFVCEWLFFRFQRKPFVFFPFVFCLRFLRKLLRSNIAHRPRRGGQSQAGFCGSKSDDSHRKEMRTVAGWLLRKQK